MLDGLSASLVSFAISVLELLPTSPFVYLDELGQQDFYEWLQMLNWFIPINTFAVILESWLVAVGIYYIYQIVLRWIKVIE